MSFASLLDHFGRLRIAILGDVMLDEYVFGTVNRISPEAPVMVVRQQSQRCVPGGAANVALNAAALGATTYVMGVAGVDEPGSSLKAALAQLPVKDLVTYVPGRPTTRKTRIVANHSHQVLRIDHETDEPVDPSTERLIIDTLADAVSGADALLISDYCKGLLTPEVARQAIALARKAGVPVFANAKPLSAQLYSGATLVSLNRSEASAIVGAPISGRESGLAAALELRRRLSVDSVVVTLGEEGLVVSHSGFESHFPAPLVEAYDVAGAGDTAIASLALGVASVGFAPEAFRLAVEVAAKVVKHVGVVAPNERDLAELRDLG